MDDIALYAGGNLVLNGSVEGGTTVVAGEVFGSLDVDSIFGARSLSSEGFDSARGEVFFNNSIRGVGGPGSVLDGPITSVTGGIEISSSTTVNGDVTAGQSVSQTFTFATINGNIIAGSDVLIEGTVNGDVTHQGNLTVGTFAEITGTQSVGGPVNLELFVAPSLPEASDLSAGFNDINLATFEDISLAPGIYGSLNFGSANTVSLSTGIYVFENVVSDFSLNELSFDTTNGGIFVFIAAENVSLDLIQSINGVRLSGLDPALNEADNITLEVGRNLDLNSDLFGNVFVPNGALTLGTFTTLTGQALVGGDVIFEGSNSIRKVNFVLGDVSGDAAANFLDIAPFISLLTNGDFQDEADIDRSGSVDFLDIAGFITILSGQ